MEKVNEKTINNVKQNKIKYLVKDFAKYGVSEDITREILLRRGINKWLANRMAIIGLKDDLKVEIKRILGLMEFYNKKGSASKNHPIYRGFVGELRVLIKTRDKIREICHSSRWQFPE